MVKLHLLEHSNAVEHLAYSVETTPGNLRYMHLWKPSGRTPWASLTIVHGLGDHGGRFASIANSLASAGLGVATLDLIGHGRSPGRRGVIPSYDFLLDEVGNMVNATQRLWPHAPSTVMGQSMGGNLVLNWAARRRFEAKAVAGVVAIAPMLRTVRPMNPQWIRAGRWIAGYLPRLRVKAPVDVRQLCHDPSGQDAYRCDPLVHRKVSLGLGIALVDSGQWLLDNAGEWDKPTLLMHGLDDTITCPLATEEFAERAGRQAALKLWPHCRHDLHFEMQRETIAAYLVHWLRERVLQLPASRRKIAA